MTASNTTDSTVSTSPTGSVNGKASSITLIRMTPPSSRFQAAEQAVLANLKMAPMAARGIRTFWSMACSTTSPENIIHIGYWRVNEPAAESGSTDDAALAIEWFAEDDTSLDTYEYTIDHVIEHGLEGSPTFVFHTTDPAAEDSPFRWLLAINPLPSRKAFAEGGLLSHLHFQYANDLHTLVATDEATGVETLRNPRWYATMCANEGTVEDRCAIIRALHHLQKTWQHTAVTAPH